MKKDDLRFGIASILQSLRLKKGMSKNRMAEYLGINKRTWYAWESGESSPNIVDFINIFTECGESMLRPIFEMLYSGHSGKSVDTRETMKKFTDEIATDHQCEIMKFFALGDHGSNFAPQMELFCAYNHLPMEQRFFVAEMVYTSFLIASNRGDLIATDSVMPDMKIWQSGLKASQRAAYQRLNSYTTITED